MKEVYRYTPTLDVRHNKSQNNEIVLLRPKKVSGCPQLRGCSCNSNFLGFSLGAIVFPWDFSDDFK